MPLGIFLLRPSDQPHDYVCAGPIIKLPPPTLFCCQWLPEPHWEIAAGMKIANSDSIWRSGINFLTKHLKVWGWFKGRLRSKAPVAEGISHSALELKDPGSSRAQGNSSFFHTFSQTNPLLLLLCSRMTSQQTTKMKLLGLCFHFWRLCGQIEQQIMPLKIFLLQLNDRPHDEVCGSPIIKLPPPALFYCQSLP